MADPNISYKRLSYAWSVVVDALNFLIGNINKDATWDANKFVTTDGSGTMTAQGGWATSAPPQVSVNGSVGSNTSIASGDHSHPNTCPLPEVPNQIANMDYVDTKSKSYAFLRNINTPIAADNTTIKYNDVVLLKNMVVNENGSVTINKAGIYRISFYGSYVASTAATISAVVYKYTTTEASTGIGSKGTRSGAPDTTVSGGASGIFNANVGDRFYVVLYSATNGVLLTHSFAGFSIESI